MTDREKFRQQIPDAEPMTVGPWFVLAVVVGAIFWAWFLNAVVWPFLTWWVW